MNTTFIGTPNYTEGRQGTAIDRIVIHYMAGNLASCDSAFQDISKWRSAHAGIEDQEVHVYVADEDTAWHAGDWQMNLRSIGIEHSATLSRAPSDDTYETSARLIADKCKKYGIPCDRAHIIRHSEVVPTQCCGTVDIDRIVNRAAQILGDGYEVVAQPSQAPQIALGDNVISWYGQVTVTGDANVRSEPNTSSPAGQGNTPDGNLHAGDVIDIVGYTVAQDPYGDGHNIWLKTCNSNWVWAKNTTFNLGGNIHPAAAGGTVMITVDTLNVRSEPNTSSTAYRANTPDGCLHYGNIVNYVREVQGESVDGNSTWYESTRGNYFSAIGCQKY